MFSRNLIGSTVTVPFAREQYGLIARANYLYGMLRAADVPKYCGKQSVTVVEFGVASGAGMLNMIGLAPMIEKETGIHLRIVGFDTGQGLPSVQGYKDHPELWRAGDFATEDRETLMRAVGGRAEIIWGDIADTIGPFTDSINSAAPLGFLSVDLDIYSTTTVALRCLTGQPEKYNPGISMYFDDVSFFSQMTGLANWQQLPNSTSSMNLERSGLTVVYRDADLDSRRVGIRKCTSVTCSTTKFARILVTGDNWQFAITPSTWRRSFFSEHIL